MIQTLRSSRNGNAHYPREHAAREMRRCVSLCAGYAGFPILKIINTLVRGYIQWKHTHTKSQIEWVAITELTEFRQNFHFIDFTKLRFEILDNSSNPRKQLTELCKL